MLSLVAGMREALFRRTIAHSVLWWCCEDCGMRISRDAHVAEARSNGVHPDAPDGIAYSATAATREFVDRACSDVRAGLCRSAGHARVLLPDTTGS